MEAVYGRRLASAVKSVGRAIITYERELEVRMLSGRDAMDRTSGLPPSGVDPSFDEALAEWVTLVGDDGRAPVEDWERLFAESHAEYRALLARGLWVSGFSDLMHIAGVAQLEIPHSNMIRWLLDPAGRHGLGGRLLRDLMRDGWGDLAAPDVESAVLEREVGRGHRFADIVVYMGPVTLVIENKVWAAESLGQTEDLYQLWKGPHEQSDVRFLLLTLDGHAPRQTRTEAAARAWRRVSYASLGGWLSENLPKSPRSTAELVADQYLATIRRTCRGTQPFQVQIGGGTVRGLD